MTKQQAELHDWLVLNRSGRVHMRRYYRQMRRFLPRDRTRDDIKATLFGIWVGRHSGWTDR